MTVFSGLCSPVADSPVATRWAARQIKKHPFAARTMHSWSMCRCRGTLCSHAPVLRLLEALRSLLELCSCALLLSKLSRACVASRVLGTQDRSSALGRPFKPLPEALVLETDRRSAEPRAETVLLLCCAPRACGGGLQVINGSPPSGAEGEFVGVAQ